MMTIFIIFDDLFVLVSKKPYLSLVFNFPIFFFILVFLLVLISLFHFFRFCQFQFPTYLTKERRSDQVFNNIRELIPSDLADVSFFAARDVCGSGGYSTNHEGIDLCRFSF